MLRIHQLARRRDDVRGRHYHRDIEVSVLEIELTGSDVWLVVPAVHIVVDGETRVPLRNLVERTVVPHSSATLWRHVESPGEVDIEGSPRSQWCRKIHPHRRAVSRVLRRSAGDANRFERQPAIESLTGEIEGRAEENQRRLIELIGDAVRRAEILLDEHPQVRQRVRRPIDVADGLAPAYFVFRRIEDRVDLVIDLLLPVLRSRSATPRSHFIRGRENQGPKRIRSRHRLRLPQDTGGEKRRQNDR